MWRALLYQYGLHDRGSIPGTDRDYFFLFTTVSGSTLRTIQFLPIQWVSGVGIAQWYSAGLRAVWSGVRVPVLGPTRTPIQLVPGALSLDIKQPGREADHSPPSIAEVKDAWSYTFTPPIRLHVVFGYRTTLLSSAAREELQALWTPNRLSSELFLPLCNTTKFDP
jgi:hypothetical protein